MKIKKNKNRPKAKPIRQQKMKKKPSQTLSSSRKSVPLRTVKRTPNRSTNREAPTLLQEFQRLVEIVQQLRNPQGGCPWDLEQTQESLSPFAIEEAYELVEAIEQKDQSLVREELGDFLLQVILHAQIANENSFFTLESVLKGINDKMVSRHPHVFGDLKLSSSKDVLKNWDKIKNQEKESKKIKGKKGNEEAQVHRGPFTHPLNLPALQSSGKIGNKTNKLHFDWSAPQEVFVKVREEMKELEEAIALGVSQEIEHEIGDLIFSLAQLARHYHLEPETVLRKTNKRFEDRFNKMVDAFYKESSSQDLSKFVQLPLNEKEYYWKKAKSTTSH